MKLANKLIKEIEKSDFSVHYDGNGMYSFYKFSSAGQDFGFQIDTGRSMKDFKKDILETYENFDVSYEAYLWLDEYGHGKNGAPYDMKDVYTDMEECKEFINELYHIVKNFAENSSKGDNENEN